MNPQSPPLRHGANLSLSERQAKPLLMLIRDKARARPSEPQWQALGDSLLVGDPIADTLADWLQRGERRARWQAFEQCLHHGIASQPDAPEPLGRFFAVVESPPAWLDWERVNRGIAASALSGRTGMRVLRDLGLMAGYQASAINQTLVMTGALESGAAKRVAETTKWWMDCTSARSLEPGAPGYRSTLQVRLIHALVRRNLLQRPDWSTEHWGVPINQLDMQATYLAFSLLYIIGQRAMGTLIRRREAEDIMHLWRYIGWLMGLDESLLCETQQDALVALYQNLLSQPVADETSQQLGRALMDEPLGRHYPRLGWLHGRWEKQVHLSIIRWFIGKPGLKALGLPRGTLPWYPILFAPANALWCGLHRILPGGRERLIRQGRAAQHRQLRRLFGEALPEILKRTI
ncbi:MAG: DUF2236 domain-containing protein [Halomonadaceae bacterium]|nr:MAG: DUF2236 domain-containing protein [Halomonadaceae bacterium]